MNAMLPLLLGYEPPPSDALHEHASALYTRRHEAAPVPRVDMRSVVNSGEQWVKPRVAFCRISV
jgi:hypothetical protein